MEILIFLFFIGIVKDIILILAYFACSVLGCITSAIPCFKKRNIFYELAEHLEWKLDI